MNSSNRADYYRYLAKLNFLCAEAADKEIGLLPGYEVAAPPPVMTLCAHAIELALKSYLLQKGLDENEVRKLGHDLVAAWEKAQRVGEELPSIDRHILEIISDLQISGRLRYGEKSDLGSVPVYGPLTRLVQQMLDLCGAPTFLDGMH